VLFPILKRQNGGLALAYVTARVDLAQIGGKLIENKPEQRLAVCLRGTGGRCSSQNERPSAVVEVALPSPLAARHREGHSQRDVRVARITRWPVRRRQQLPAEVELVREPIDDEIELSKPPCFRRSEALSGIPWFEPQAEEQRGLLRS